MIPKEIKNADFRHEKFMVEKREACAPRLISIRATGASFSLCTLKLIKILGAHAYSLKPPATIGQLIDNTLKGAALWAETNQSLHLTSPPIGGLQMSSIRYMACKN